jgi:NAD(P)-dependent dehydrogenase (short-subunit alcohol dehydrogenase family)
LTKYKTKDLTMNIQNKVVVVTGSSAGVGRATALKFAREGGNVALLARGAAGLEGARREIESLGCRCIAISVDVSDAEAVDAAAERVEKELGSIDVWVNNAMASVFSPVKKMKAEEYKRVTEVTYLGAVYGTLAALKRMLPRDSGVIVQVGSALAYRGIPLQSAYCGSKHAIQGFTDSLRTELLHDKSKVRVCMVQMPALNTPQFSWVKSRLPHKAQPVPPIFQPEVAADAIYFAATHKRREIMVGFPTLKAIIGNRIAPGYADQVLAQTGYSGQQTEEPRDKDQRNNLWEPVDAEFDFGAHGTFDNRARSFSPFLWLTVNRRWLGWAGAALAGFAALKVLLSPIQDIQIYEETEGR